MAEPNSTPSSSEGHLHQMNQHASVAESGLCTVAVVAGISLLALSVPLILAVSYLAKSRSKNCLFGDEKNPFAKSESTYPHVG